MVTVAWVVLHCNRRIGARERRQLIPHVRFQVPFLGPESQLKLSAMPAQQMKAPEQACEDTSQAKIDVTSKSPVGVTRTRTDTMEPASSAPLPRFCVVQFSKALPKTSL